MHKDRGKLWSQLSRPKCRSAEWRRKDAAWFLCPWREFPRSTVLMDSRTSASMQSDERGVMNRQIADRPLLQLGDYFFQIAYSLEWGRLESWSRRTNKKELARHGR
jgi:hypothetical protein